MADLTDRQRQIRGCRKTCTTDTHEAGCTSNDAVIGRADPEVAAQKQLAMKQYREQYGDPLSRIKPTVIGTTVGGGTFIGVEPKGEPAGYFTEEEMWEEPLGQRHPVFPLPKVKPATWKAWLGWKLIKLGRWLTKEKP